MTMLICDANLKIFEILRFFRFHQLLPTFRKLVTQGGAISPLNRYLLRL